LGEDECWSLTPAFDAATSFGAMLAAYRCARRDKPKTAEMDRFEAERERRLLDLQTALRDGTWQPGPARQHTIYDRKPRVITCAPFVDRVAHQVIVRACAHDLDRALPPEVYSNRVGSGTHAALARYRVLAAKAPFVLTLDVCGYFHAIDHAILAQQVGALVRDPSARDYLLRVVDASPPPPTAPDYFDGDDLFTPHARRRGLPLGNLVSQTLANLFLAPLDATVRALPGVVGHVRYVDDLMVFGRSRAALRHARAEAVRSAAHLRLRLHEDRAGIHDTRRGLRFLGLVVSRDGCRLPTEARRDFAHRFQGLRAACRRGTVTLEQVSAAVAGWSGHAQHGMSEKALDRFLRRTTVLG